LQNCYITVPYVLLSSVLAVLFPNVTNILSIMGGLCVVSVCFVIPTLTYVKIKTPHGESYFSGDYKLPIMICSLILAIIGYTSVFMTVKEMI
jgi:UDP-N-acetylmuramyl pentapeptide phosphotransferase/UDP-N-acetylglucosamine-1-phosphate transferase